MEEDRMLIKALMEPANGWKTTYVGCYCFTSLLRPQSACRETGPERSGFVQKEVPDKRRISNKTTLTLTLSRPTGEGTARPAFRSVQNGWIRS